MFAMVTKTELQYFREVKPYLKWKLAIIGFTHIWRMRKGLAHVSLKSHSSVRWYHPIHEGTGDWGGTADGTI